MKIFVLKLYRSEHKMRDDCDIAGYYTSKAALIRELNKHYEELGVCGLYTIEEHAKLDFRYFDADTDFASVEVVESNQWTA